MKIKCHFEELDLVQMKVLKGKLKKHSMLEIERMKDSLMQDGLLSPFIIGELNNIYYILDGEARYYALDELDNDDKLPCFIIHCSDENELKKYMLILLSTNHATTEVALKKFVENTNLNLKDYTFNTSDLIDFHTDVDIGLYEYTNGGKFSEQKLNKKDFEGMWNL